MNQVPGGVFQGRLDHAVLGVAAAALWPPAPDCQAAVPAGLGSGAGVPRPLLVDLHELAASIQVPLAWSQVIARPSHELLVDPHESLDHEAVHELGRDVLRIGRAPAVAEEQDLVAVLNRVGHEPRDLLEGFAVLGSEGLLRGDRGGEGAPDDVLHDEADHTRARPEMPSGAPRHSVLADPSHLALTTARIGP